MRKICPECKQEFKLTQENIADLERMTDTKKMLGLFKKNDCLKTGEQKMDSWTFYRGAGCHKCNNEGYKGRMGIYEILVVDKTMAELINKKATVGEIKKAAVANGFINILVDGLVKAKKGLTTIEEVLARSPHVIFSVIVGNILISFCLSKISKPSTPFCTPRLYNSSTTFLSFPITNAPLLTSSTWSS